MKYYVADAFTDKVFGGNPAGICIPYNEISDETMQKIACENNLSETAFLKKIGESYSLRWFTPTFEIDLCGHATLASAFIVLEFLEKGADRVLFDTMSGRIAVEKKNGAYEISFPIRRAEKIQVTEEISEALGFVPTELYSARDLFAVMESEEDVKNFVPDYRKLSVLDKWLGIAVTARGRECDFVSRFFCPELLREDPVTGSSHSSLVPLWSEKLGRAEMTARQLSSRGGTLYCRLCSDDIKLSGKAVLYMQGDIKI